MRHATRTTAGDETHEAQAPRVQGTRSLSASRRLSLIFLGGAAGAVARTALTFPAIHSAHQAAPAMEAALLLGINVLGALLLGLLISSVTARTAHADAIRALLGTGALGGFTSYSSLVLLAAPAGGAWPVGFYLALASLALGLIAAWAGLTGGATLRGRRLT